MPTTTELVKEGKRNRANIEEAVRYFKQAIKQAEDSFCAHTNIYGEAWAELAGVYRSDKKRMYKESIDAFEKAFPLLQPRHKAYGEYLYGYGTALFHVERKSEALYCLKKASDIGYSSSPDIDTLIRDGVTPSAPEIFKSEEARELERQRQAEEGRRMATLTKLLNVTDILEVDRLAKFLDLDPEECWQRLPDWAERFKFRIRKNCVDFSNGQKDAFIAELKNDFLNWERGVEKKL